MKKNLVFGITTFMLALLSIATISSCSTDKCKGVTCQNGGTCNDGTCACATGYEGANCQTRVNAKFAGTYTGSTPCEPNVVALGITAATASPLIITIEYLESAGTWVELEATVSGNTITISPQAKNITGNNYTVDGSGTLSGNNITLTITLDDGTGSPSPCNFTGTK